MQGQPSGCTYVVNGRLFVAQAFYGIELGGADGGKGAEQDADQRGDDDGDDGGESGNGDAIGGEEADGEGDGESDDDAEDSADQGDEDSFGEELEANLAVGGAHRFSDSDLANACADGRQHDGHDSDAAHQQDNQRDSEKNHGQAGGDTVHHGEHRGEILHAINGFGAVAGLNYALDLWSGCDHHG